MSGRIESFLLRAQEHGCNNCGEQVDSFYTVEFYFMPSRLVRKRHKERVQNAIYCRDCYECHTELPFLVDGEAIALPIGKAIVPSELRCRICRSDCNSSIHPELHGIIASTFWAGVNPMESLPLAVFCAECVESQRISLLAKIR